MEDFTSFGDITIEEGVVTGRNFYKPDLTTLEAADVNGPPGAKGQYVWDGSYSVSLLRGLHVGRVYSSDLFGLTGQDVRKCIPINEKVTVIWMNRFNAQIPVILNGVTIDGYIKQMFGKGHLLDQGEYIIRSAISNTPENNALGKPFSDNQFDQKLTSPDAKENIDKAVKNPGGEAFFDKFGRLSLLSRQKDHEFLVTVGKIDSGQDDVSNLATVSDQDAYYNKILNDESRPVDATEPLKPKDINLTQYQQTVKDFKDSTGVLYKKGLLPRFDKWIFKPIVVRKYALDSDGEVAYFTDVYAVYQERGELYVKTITSLGDAKVYLDGYINQRIKKDCLLSIGGNLDIKIKPHDRDDNGAAASNLLHIEGLADGSFRIRVNEDSSFNGTIDLKLDPTGVVTLNAKKKIVIDSDENIYVGGEDGAEPIPLGTKIKTYLDSFMAQVFDSWIPIPGDGAASLKAAYLAWKSLPTTDANYLSTSRKVN